MLLFVVLAPLTVTVSNSEESLQYCPSFYEPPFQSEEEKIKYEEQLIPSRDKVENWDKIKIGMTKEEVKKILGEPDYSSGAAIKLDAKEQPKCRVEIYNYNTIKNMRVKNFVCNEHLLYAVVFGEDCMVTSFYKPQKTFKN